MAKKTGPIRFGVIGSGNAGRNRVVQLAKHELGVDIVAVADTAPDHITLQEQAIGKQVRRFTGPDGYRQMIDEVELDAVGVFTPHTLHYEHAMYALNAGKHLLIEKPMVCGGGRALEVAKLAKAKGLVCMIHYQRHFEAQFVKARELIRKGVIGNVTTFYVYMVQDWSGREWRGDPAFSGGGQINDSGSHYQDILLWMTDLLPKSAEGAIDSYYQGQKKRVEINGSFNVELSNGAGGRIIILGDTMGGFSDDVRIRGDKGDLLLYGPRLVHRANGQQPVDVQTGVPKGYPVSPCDNFVKLLYGKTKTNHVPPKFGARVALLTDTMLEAARVGRKVEAAEMLARAGASVKELE